jgi:diguanylate cyclase (GGDEF)-like protein
METADDIWVTRTVYLKEDVVGWLMMQTSTAPLRERLNFYVWVNLLSIFVGFAIAYPLSHRIKKSITGPISELTAIADHVTKHNDYSLSTETNASADEIGHLSRAFNTMLSGIQQRDVKLSQLAYYDAVTGLPNRHYFTERLNDAVAHTHQYGSECCLMFIDLDNFKTVNDTHGHHVGDELLREIARRLRCVTRENDFVCRLGGDEFALVLEGIKDLTGATVLAGKLITELSKPMTILGVSAAVGASIGLAACPDHATDTHELLRTADTAMYAAKEAGKNCYRVYTATMESAHS